MTPENPNARPAQIELATFAPEVRSGYTEKIKTLTILPDRRTHVVVVGAGVFGCWTALHLLRRGCRVTLLDAWGPGNSRSSSGDETRVIRCIYGANETYFDLCVRALTLWREFEQQVKQPLLFPAGLVWLLYQPRVETIDDALPFLRKHDLPYEELSLREAARRYPQMNFSGLDHVFVEKAAGYLRARHSCQVVTESFVREGGIYRQASAMPGTITRSAMREIQVSDGSAIQADAYAFACGPWLPQLFPGLLQPFLYSARQEVYYFGTPADQGAAFDELPVWIDWNTADTIYYGIPGSTHRGFKTAYDRTGGGELFDPTHGERVITPAELASARRFLAQRFPALKDAPLTESRVCQYPNSPDGNFVIDTHPEADNVWLLGGGSGHGFKFGPALGESITRVMLGEQALPTMFALNRFRPDVP